MNCYTSPSQETYNYRKRNDPKSKIFSDCGNSTFSYNVPFSAPPKVFVPSPVDPVAPFLKALMTDKAYPKKELKNHHTLTG